MFKLFRHHHHICQLEFFVQFGFFFSLLYSQNDLLVVHTQNRMVKVIADEFLTDDRERKYYADRYSCCPPPLFIIFITLVEVSFFFYYFLGVFSHHTQNPEPKFFLLCRDSRHVFASEREGTCALKSNRTPPSMVSIDFFLVFCFFFHLLL